MRASYGRIFVYPFLPRGTLFEIGYVRIRKKERSDQMALPTRVLRAMNDPFVDLHRDFDQMIGRFLRPPTDGGTNWAPYAVDVREDADHLYVEAELPGFKKDEIDITLENQTLTISAERGDRKEQTQGDYLLNERRYGRFLRSFTLPPTVDEKSVDAKLADGVLHITLNKREETKPRKIQVS
jgi:HSP20 family protein